MREILVKEIRDLETRSIDCRKCVGHCCTFIANSMMINAAEASDIFEDLTNRKLLTPELIKHITKTIKRYSLDRASAGNGKRDFSRKTYTCPFFNWGTQGCLVSLHSKPLGCLAFNPSNANEAEGTSCKLNSDVLNIQKQSLPDIYSNDEKLPIPVAILRLINKNQLE